MHKKSFPNASKTASSTKPQSLETLTTSFSLVHLENTRALSMWLRQGFPANHSHWQERKKAKTTRATCGPKRSKRFVTFSQDSPFSKTSPVCLILATSTKSSARWPKQGSMQDGLCWEQTMLEHRTEENDSGYWRTPTASDWKNMDTAKQPMLSAQVKWPTPRAFSAMAAGMETLRKRGRDRGNLEERVAMQGGCGQLNSKWVSWLMGWPIGWVDLEPMKEIEFLPFDPEPNIPRVTTGEKDRAKKLKALGNGQVPRVAATAWAILTRDFDL